CRRPRPRADPDAPDHHEPRFQPGPQCPARRHRPRHCRRVPGHTRPGAGDAAKTTGPLKPIWRFFGADEPNYAYMKDGQKLIADIGALAPKRMYFRAHSLLVTGDGTPALKWGSTNAYTEDAQGNPKYDWTIVDRIFDTYLARGVKPYVQIGFMPKAMSTTPEPYQHKWAPDQRYNEIFTGWAYPPKDFTKWEELAYQWAKHSVEKYGKAEVETWYWETWNEANIGYWK